MNNSSRNSAPSTKNSIKVRVKEEREKNENIYIIICPEERLVLSRTISVKGRIIWLKISTNGKKSIKPEGDPNGNMCARKSRAWVLKITTIKDTHNVMEAEQVK
jgi:hypothetical protein